MELNYHPTRGTGTEMKTVLVSIAAALLLTALLPGSASARLQPPAKPNSNVEIVEFDGEYERGTIVVRTSEKSLYYVLGDGEALRYPVAVGEPRFQLQTGQSDLAAHGAHAAGESAAAQGGRAGTAQSARSEGALSWLGRISYPRNQRAAFGRFRRIQRLLSYA
jgi:lipoprotein-anchoring transpeptidase ErfK/SrfK